jgi:Ser/Thr protein kinase RdoA (MazF antagonist)
MLSEALLKELNLQGASVKSLHLGVNETFLITGKSVSLVVKQRIEKKSADYSPFAEMSWLSRLAEKGFPCVRPFDNNNNVIELEGDTFLLYEYIKGEEPDRKQSSSCFKAGQLLRQLHVTANQLVSSNNDFDRPVYNRTFVIDKFLPVIASSEIFDDHAKEVLIHLGQQIGDNFPQDNGFIHGDFHLGNLLETKDNTKVLDFDECGYGSIYYDVGTMRLHTLARGNEELWHSFLAGYDKELDENALRYGAAARIFYLIGSIPFRMNVNDIAKTSQEIIQRYTGYIEKILQLL